MCAWHGDRLRHSKASRGIKTGRKTYNHINPTATKMWRKDRDFQLAYAKRVLRIPNPEQYTTARLATLIERKESGFMYDVIGKKQLHEILNKKTGKYDYDIKKEHKEFNKLTDNEFETLFREGSKTRDPSPEAWDRRKSKKRKRFEEDMDPIYRDYPYERKKERKGDKDLTVEEMLLLNPDMFERKGYTIHKRSSDEVRDSDNVRTRMYGRKKIPEYKRHGSFYHESNPAEYTGNALLSYEKSGHEIVSPRGEEKTLETYQKLVPIDMRFNRKRSGNMTLSKKFLKKSIKDEKAAAKTYTKHAKGKGNKFLKEIAKDERHHKKLLTKRLKTISKKKK